MEMTVLGRTSPIPVSVDFFLLLAGILFVHGKVRPHI